MAIALLCIAAVGVSATTLESTVSTDPDDAISFEYDRVPLGSDLVRSIDDELDVRRADERSRETDPEDVPEDVSAEDVPENVSAEDVPENATSGDLPDDAAAGLPAGAPGPGAAGGDSPEPPERIDERAAGGKAGPEESSGDDARDSGDGTVSLPAVDGPVGSTSGGLLVGALVGSGAVAYRYRSRLNSPFSGDDTAGAVPETGAGTDTADASDRRGAGAGWPPRAGGDEIQRAWIQLVRDLDVSRPSATTPAEFRAAAIEAGHDPEVVETITRAFREVRYGQGTVDKRRRERVRRWLERTEEGAE